VANDQLARDCDALIIQGAPSEEEKIRLLADKIAARRLIWEQAGTAVSAQPVTGNTIALSSASRPQVAQWWVLQSQPIQLPRELIELMNRKEAACEASQRLLRSCPWIS